MSRKVLSFWLLLIPDAFFLYVALVVSLLFRYGQVQPSVLNAHLRAFSVIFLLWLLVFFIHGLFEVSTFRRYVLLLVNIFSAMVVNVLVAISYFYFQPNLILTPRRFLLIDVAVAFIFISLWHLVAKYFFKNKLVEGVYLFTNGSEFTELEKEIRSQSFLGFRVIGHLDERSLSSVKLEKKSSVILPDDLHSSPGISSQLYQLRTQGVTFYNHKDFYEFLLRRIFLSDLNELWFLENINYKEKRLYGMVKRLVDIIFGFVAFVVFLITYPILALLIKFETPGNVLFVQDRVGQNGVTFQIYKYRTMYGGKTDTWTEKNDPRITKLGNILRKTRIDELPQSINLMKGNISLVGPRPEQVGIVEKLRTQIPFYDERHLVKPGLTGWAQLNIYAGSLEETRLKLQYDLYYIKHRSFLFDLEIILKTVYYVFTWQGR